MKVRCTVTIDIDPEAYLLEYGVARSQLRADVQLHVQDSLHAHFTEIGVLL